MYLFRFSLTMCGLGDLAALRRRALDDAHDVAFFHDHQVFAVDLHFGTRPLAEQDTVAHLHVERDELALLIASARTGGNDLAFHRLLLCGVGDDDPTRSLRILLHAPNDDAVVQGTELHETPPLIWKFENVCWLE